MSLERIQLNLRLDRHPELFDALKEVSETTGVSINSFAIHALKASLGLEVSTTQPSSSSELASLAAKVEALEKRLEMHHQVLERLAVTPMVF
ncbi:MAG: hypothetical protein F6K32_20955 [Desertifilum sp. SIO1I2]|nr:hypothetical protein [Desertifilum sp. SIO1I2]